MDGKNYLVLSVDDDPCISRVVQLKLENAGYKVVRAVTAEEALVKIKDIHPDVIITDVMMPGMNGIDLCKACDEMLPDGDFLTIVLTGQVDDELKTWVESSPRRRFISKPFSPRKILATIEKYRAAKESMCVA